MPNAAAKVSQGRFLLWLIPNGYVLIAGFLLSAKGQLLKAGLVAYMSFLTHCR